jgi:hypothetical protein
LSGFSSEKERIMCQYRYFNDEDTRWDWLQTHMIPCEECGHPVSGKVAIEVGKGDNMGVVHPHCYQSYENKHQKHLAPVLKLVPRVEVVSAEELEDMAA